MTMNASTPLIYNQSLALLTDLYQLTMAYGYWKNGLQDKEAVFHLFFRKRPFNGGYTIAAGLELVIDYLKHFRFQPDDLEYLATLRDAEGGPLFEEAFFDYLANIEFTCDVDAVPEGTVVFPYEPMVRVKGPLIQAQILETPLLNLINFSSLIATKASRICISAAGDEVLEFGLRRAQGIDGAITAARSAYIGGCSSTSNVLAGKLFGIPVRGTHSHSWVMTFDDELESFQAYAKALPANCIFLVDTYNTVEGVKKAIEVGNWLKSEGKRMLGIRLDSGDLAYLSKVSRRMLDDAGFEDAVIVASNELDETIIGDLKKQGATIAVWGVGTNLITAKDQPALDGVYKLSAVRDVGEEWQFRLKLSEQMTKISNPGVLQIRRYYDQNEYLADAIFNEGDDLSEECCIVDPLDSTRQKRVDPTLSYQDLLIPIFKEGQLVYATPSLKEIRAKVQTELSRFHEGIKRFIYPHQYVVGLEKSLYERKVELIRKIRKLK
jgi:nicotinate phosphoribosyltransferase